MKLVIPSECKIAAFTYSIVTNDKLLEKLEDRASCNIKEQIIRLQKKEVKAEQIFVELLHEIDHLIDDVTGSKTDEEVRIAKTNILAQVLLSLGIEPDFSQIPEEEI